MSSIIEHDTGSERIPAHAGPVLLSPRKRAAFAAWHPSNSERRTFAIDELSLSRERCSPTTSKPEEQHIIEQQQMAKQTNPTQQGKTATQVAIPVDRTLVPFLIGKGGATVKAVETHASKLGWRVCYMVVVW